MWGREAEMWKLKRDSFRKRVAWEVVHQQSKLSGLFILSDRHGVWMAPSHRYCGPGLVSVRTSQTCVCLQFSVKLAPAPCSRSGTCDFCGCVWFVQSCVFCLFLHDIIEDLMGIALKVAQRTQKQSTMTSLDIGFEFFFLCSESDLWFQNCATSITPKKTDLMPGWWV